MVGVLCMLGNEILGYQIVPNDEMEKARINLIQRAKWEWELTPTNIEFRYWVHSKDGKVKFLPSRI